MGRLSRWASAAPAAVAAIAATLLSAWATPPPANVVKLGGAIETLEGGRTRARAILEVAPGFHINAHRPRQTFLIPTELTLVGGSFGAPSYPEPVDMRLAFAGEESLLVYDGTVRISAESDRPPDGPVFAKLRYQACDEERCLPPRTIEALLAPAKGGPGAGTTAAAEGSVGEQAKAPAPTGAPGGIEGDAGSRATDRQPWLARWLARASLPAAVAMTFVLGLGLNLTPCVYPLVSVTVAFFGHQARPGLRSLPLSIAYVAGITLTFALLGTSAALFGGLVGAPLQHPVVPISLAALLVALAASSFGLFEIRAPSALMERFGRASGGVAGALLMGLTMGIVAAPCIGRVVLGLLLYVGAKRDAVLGFLLFLSMGLGMGLPYVLLAAAAGSIGSLPRSGEWLRWMNRLFGVILLGMALYFVAPLLPPGVARFALPTLLAVAGLNLGFLEPSGRNLRGFTRLRRGLGTAAIATAAWLGLASGLRATPAGSGIRWEPLAVDSIDRAIASRRPTILEFGAEWCMPCGLMERTTFADAEVTREAGRFSMLQADVTENSPENEALLGRFGVLGVPTVIFFNAHGVEVDRVVGYVDSVRFTDLLRKVAAAPGAPGANERTEAAPSDVARDRN